MNELRASVLSKFKVEDLSNPVTAKSITAKLNQADDLYRLDFIDNVLRRETMNQIFGELPNSCRKCGEPVRDGYTLCLGCSI